MTALRCPTFAPLRRLLFLAGLAGSLVLSAADKADAATTLAPRAFDVRAGAAAKTLREFSTQAGVELIYSTDAVQGVTTQAVKGEFSPAAALERMLADTPLRIVKDAKPGAFALRREARPDPNVPSRRAIDAATAEQESAASPVRVESGAVKLDDYAVTGSRIRRDPTELGASPVQVFDRQAIERSGAISMSDFANRLTQNSNDLTGLSGSGPLGARTTFNLRGLGNTTTLVLVNGRRIPKSGQGFNQEDYDVGGIPLSAVERIEVLTDGASAIYGADAIGGVVNIITRKNYRGSTLTMQYGNSFHRDAAEKALSLSTGFGGDRFSGFLTVAANERNGFGNADRAYTATDNRAATGGRDLREPEGGGAGFVMSAFGDVLPGLNDFVAVIPPGQDGRSLTTDDFLPYEGLAVPFDAAPYRDSVQPTRLLSARGSFRYEFGPAAELYLEAAHSKQRTYERGPPPLATIVVPFDHPFNPFGDDVVVIKHLHELGPSLVLFDSIERSVATGLRGELRGSWRYDLGYSYARQESINTSPLPGSLGSTLFAPLVTDSNPATTFNVFGDSRSAAFDGGLLGRLGAVDDYEAVATTAGWDVWAGGNLFSWSGRDVRLAIAGERRDERVAFLVNNNTDTSFAQVRTDSRRRVTSGFAELLIPLVDAANPWPGARSLELQAAGRIDRYSDLGSELSPKFGMLWRPARGWNVRASTGHGFKTPSLFMLRNPPVARPGTRFTPSSAPLDRVRNELVRGPLLFTRGGNPDLRAEQSRSVNAGIVFEPAALPGLSLAADYFHLRYTDRVVNSVPLQDILDFFPDRYTRAPTVNGVPGAITAIDARSVNLSRTETRGVDFSLTFQRTTTLGRWDYTLRMTRILGYVDQASPTAPEVERLGQPGFARWRANASVFWQRGRHEAGVNWRYVDATLRSASFLVAGGPREIDRAHEFDFQYSYDFGRDGHRTGWRRWAWQGTRVSVGLINVLDAEPPATNGDGGFARLDPRQRRYYVSLRRDF